MLIMQNTLLTAAIACVMGAIVGGGLKAFGIEVPLLSSRKRQILLAFLGIVLAVVAFSVNGDGSRRMSDNERSALRREQSENGHDIIRYQDILTRLVEKEAVLKENVAEQRKEMGDMHPSPDLDRARRVLANAQGELAKAAVTEKSLQDDIQNMRNRNQEIQKLLDENR